MNDIKEAATRLAAAMHGGTVTPELRAEFIALREALFQRGIFDPVLARFDSATVSRATVEDVAKQLEQIASSE